MVEKGENSGVRADAQGQSQDGYGREAGSAREHAEGVFQIANDSVEPPDES